MNLHDATCNRVTMVTSGGVLYGSFSEYPSAHNKFMLLLVQPYLFKSTCFKEALEFSKYVDAFGELSCQIVGVCCDAENVLYSWLNAPGINGNSNDPEIKFPIIADHSKRIHRYLGLLTEANNPLPATVIVNKAGFVCNISVHNTFSPRNIELTLNTLKSVISDENMKKQRPDNYILRETKGDTKESSAAKSSATGQISLYSRWLTESPLTANAISSCITVVLVEIIGSYIIYRQYVDSKIYDTKRNKLKPFSEFLDARKIALKGLFGLAITGPVYNLWYALLDKYICNPIQSGAGTGSIEKVLKSIVSQLVLDRFLLTPCLLALAQLYSRCLDVSLLRPLHGNIATFRNHYSALLFMNWKSLTVPQCINYGVVPNQYKTTFGIVFSSLLDLYSTLTS